MSSPSTPPTSPLPQPQEINQLLQHLNTYGTTSPYQSQSNITITPDQLNTMLRILKHQQANATPSSIVTNPPFPTSTLRLPDCHSMAKYEEIITKPLRPTYEGASDGLIPFLNRLDIRRQDESWYPVTFVTINTKTYDLLRHFTEIGESVILAEAKLRWSSPTLQQDKFAINHPTYQARVLAKLLLASLADEFSVTIIHRVGVKYRNDGVVILWTICNNVHRSNIAFTETIKAKIRNTNLSEYENIDKYLIGIKDNLSLITSSDTTDLTKHNDLIIYIFTHLKQCKVTPFYQYISRLHVQYLEASLPDLTPTKLLQLAEDKIQVLRHADQWTKLEDPAIMALQAQLTQQKHASDLTIQRLVAHVGRLAQRTLKRGPQDQSTPTNAKYPAWMIQSPHPNQHTQLVDNKIYTWCKKCRHGQGLWVCRHTTETHMDGYNARSNRPRFHDRHHQTTNPHQSYNATASSAPHAYLSQPDGAHTVTPHSTPSPPLVTAQLSILDYLDAYCDPATHTDEPSNYFDSKEYHE
jgi:hypothetical protein